MIQVKRVSSLRSAVSAARKERKTIGFVPTMGNLHEGHLELVRVAKSRCEYVVVSIYVNPTQFGANEDLEAYPHTPEEDARQLAELDVDVLFLPTQEVMYPSALEDQTVVYVPKLGVDYCGKDRPEHFQGVTTVVARLFNMVIPDVAVFGMKDYQQLAIIKRMVRDLAYPIQIVGVDTVRNSDGLALSSRNGYLTEAELATAPLFRAALVSLAKQIGNAYIQQDLRLDAIEKFIKGAKANLVEAGFKPNYLAVCDQLNLEVPQFDSQGVYDTDLVILGSATLGKARLIDNLEVDLKQAKNQ